MDHAQTDELRELIEESGLLPEDAGVGVTIEDGSVPGPTASVERRRVVKIEVSYRYEDGQ